MSRRRPHRGAVAVLTVAAALAAPPAAAGPVFTLVAQSRSVSTRAGAAGGGAVDDARQADGFLRFQGQAASDFASDDYRVTATATTDSTLSPTMLSFSGTCRVTSSDVDPGDDDAGPVDGSAVAQGWVTFRLGVAHAMKFRTSVPFPVDTDPAEPGNDYRLVRDPETGSSDDVIFDGRTRGRRSQVLPPGEYTFSYYHDATSFPGVPGREQVNQFSTSLQLAAVPLPEAAWAGAAGMGLVALMVRARRRRV
jgi:hypothetical protein